MMEKRQGWTFVVCGWLMAGVAAGGPNEAMEPIEAPPSRDYCEAWKTWGTLYKDGDNPWIQQIKIYGRVQYQVAYLDGTANGTDDFNYKTDEIRRIFFGSSVKFLDVWSLATQAVLYDDDGPVGGREGFHFQHLWDLKLMLDAQKAWGLEGLEALSLGYGKREVNMSAEWNQSSRFIKTVERSAISNKLWPYDTDFSNPTGFWVQAAQGPMSWMLGFFSTTQNEWLASWDDGELYYARLLYDLSGWTGAETSDFLWTVFYQDAPISGDRLGGGIEYATAASLRYGRDRWEILVEGIYGNNGEQTVAAREGDFYGVVILPTYWIVPDKLEAAARYQFQGAEETQGIRLYGRYARRADMKEGLGLLNGGRGDEHHSFYGGLNYYLCGDNAKVMAGVQYDDISSGSADVYQGWSFLGAFRTFF